MLELVISLGITGEVLSIGYEMIEKDITNLYRITETERSDDADYTSLRVWKTTLEVKQTPSVDTRLVWIKKHLLLVYRKPILLDAKSVGQKELPLYLISNTHYETKISTICISLLERVSIGNR